LYLFKLVYYLKYAGVFVMKASNTCW